MATLGATLTVTVPCPECSPKPILRVPVEWERRGLTLHGHIDVSEVRLAVAVHAKQHRAGA